jgi:hypothetical protein
MTRCALPAAAFLVFAVLNAGCSGGGASSTSTPSPSDTATFAPATATPFPTFTPTPALGAGAQIVVGGDLRVRSGPSTSAPPVKTLKDQARVQIDAAVQGENVLVGHRRG